MNFWKTAALSAALLGAAAAGSALAPVAHGQDDAPRATAPRAFELFTGGTRIGVSVNEVEASDTRTPAGVVIESVVDGSPAEKAGFKKGDVVVEFDGERVRSVRQFTRLVSETPAGRQVAAAVMRDGQRVSLNVTPREDRARIFADGDWRALENLRDFEVRVPPIPARPARPARPNAVPAPPRAPRPPVLDNFIWTMGNQLGVTVSDLSGQLAEYFGAKNGVLVTSVTENSAAAKAGVKAGDVIVSVNGDTVDDPMDLRQELRDVDAGEEFTLDVVRDKKPVTLKGKMEERTSRRRTIL